MDEYNNYDGNEIRYNFRTILKEIACNDRNKKK